MASDSTPEFANAGSSSQATFSHSQDTILPHRDPNAATPEAEGHRAIASNVSSDFSPYTYYLHSFLPFRY